MTDFRLARIAVCLVGIQIVTCKPDNLASARGPEGSLISGDALSWAGGKMVVISREGPVESSVDLLVHFHGAASVVTKQFNDAHIDAVLCLVNFNGLSSAYATPFQNADRFQGLLDRAMSQLRKRGKADKQTKLGRMCVSSFSAGYGAVREILKTPSHFSRIDGLLAADSIYAGVVTDGSERRVNQRQMNDFLRFARLATENKKTFLITHSYLETSYASTVETADYLLDALNIDRHEVQHADSPLPRQVNRASKGCFTVLGYEGKQGEDHLQHLRQIGRAWKRLPLRPMH